MSDTIRPAAVAAADGSGIGQQDQSLNTIVANPAQPQSRILAIDPGLGGALAFLSGDNLSVYDMPTLKIGTKRTLDEIELARLIDCNGPISTAYLELVATRPGEGAVGAFTFGRGYGVIRGILRAHFIPIVDVQPAKWKRGVGIASGATKDASRARAKEIFQRDSGLFARVRDDGRAEAALIALYGSRVQS